MQGPTGFSGVQTLRNSGHSLGAIMPRRTSPQRQPFGSIVGSTSTSCTRIASKISELVANSVAASLNGAKAAPCRGAGIEHLVNRGKRHGVAFGHDAARVCVLDFGALRATGA